MIFCPLLLSKAACYWYHCVFFRLFPIPPNQVPICFMCFADSRRKDKSTMAILSLSSSAVLTTIKQKQYDFTFMYYSECKTGTTLHMCSAGRIRHMWTAKLFVLSFSRYNPASKPCSWCFECQPSNMYGCQRAAKVQVKRLWLSRSVVFWRTKLTKRESKHACGQ
jgi:hypothetical protein